MAKAIMIQGTMSNAGKSFLAAGLCRLFVQDGLRTAPFKSQNMALNSFVTKDGGEMGRAQAVQAEACGLAPDVRMNPILLKPTTDMGSQVIVLGKAVGNMGAVEYFRKKKDYIPLIRDAYESLAKDYDLIVIEGAGSPAEINLKADDIVNMGMAKIADASVLLVGDIDCGGVFAQLYGTLALLEEEERDRIIGLVINKFRGDPEILKPGLAMLEDLTGKPVLGIIPYTDVRLEEEDSLADSLNKEMSPAPSDHCVDIAVIRLPRISNFTDFQALSLEPCVHLRYVTKRQELGEPDVIILPGTKSTMQDLSWLRKTGLEEALLLLYAKGTPVIGICGGYQMMGELLEDPENTECGGSMPGLGLLPVVTIFQEKKITVQTEGRTCSFGIPELADKEIRGYEVHMGRTEYPGSAGREKCPFSKCTSGADGYGIKDAFGTYVHGVFDSEDFRGAFLKWLTSKKPFGAETSSFVYRSYREQQYDRLADLLREQLDLEAIYRALGISPGHAFRK